MKFLLQYWGDSGKPEDSPEAAAEFQAWMALEQEMAEAGVRVEGHALMPVETATTVRSQAGKLTVVDGPFAETKEALGGFHLIDVENLDEALKWAKKAPTAEYGSVEVRPVIVFD